MEDTNTTVAYATQDRFLELASQWHAEFGDMKLEKFFNTENTSTPNMLHKRYIVSHTIAHFLRSNGVYPGARNTFIFMDACDNPEEFAMKILTKDAEEDEEDTFDYDTEYDEVDLDDCACF